MGRGIKPTKADLLAKIEAMRIVREHHDDRTLVKTYNALIQSGLTDVQANNAIDEMQNYGILFRERI